MKTSTRYIVEPDTKGDGVHSFTEHRTKKDAIKKVKYWLKRGIKPEMYSRKETHGIY